MPPSELVETWSFDECPWKEECSCKSWQRVYCKSQTSEAHCRKILWYHLCVSSLHENQSREDVYQMAMNWPIMCQMAAKWGNPDERFQDISHDIPQPDDETGHEAALEELRGAKRKLGEEAGAVRTPCPPFPSAPKAQTGCRARLEPPPPSPPHPRTHFSPGECPGQRLGLAGHVLDLPRIWFWAWTWKGEGRSHPLGPGP